MDRRADRGLSLLETLLAVVLMALTLWSVQLLYVTLLRGTNTSEARRAAVAETETLLRIWQGKTLEAWPEGIGTDDMPSPEAFEVEGLENEYLYRVEVSGRLLNPFRDDPSALVTDPVLNMQTISVTVFYSESGDSAENQHRVRLLGSVSN